MDFSILVLTYNNEFKKIRRTLDSILSQRDVSLEIILCDDASRDNHFPEIEDYLSQSNVPFQLCGSETNQGTVCNILNGLEHAHGTYAKLIGAGDMLYHSHTLSGVAAFLQKEHCSSCFTAMRGYRFNGQSYEAAEHFSPRDIQAYRTHNTEQICKNLMLCEDWVSGAAIFATTAYYRKYISLLRGSVVYCEDWASGLACIDGEYLHYMDEYGVWYEVGDGISTSSNNSFRQKLLLDNRNYWKLFDSYRAEHAPDRFAGYIRKRKRKKRLEALSCEWIKLLYKSIVTPDMVIFELRAQKQQRQKVHVPSKITESDILTLTR